MRICEHCGEQVKTWGLEMDELRTEFAHLLDRVPRESNAVSDYSDRPLQFDETERKLFRFVKPLSDPYGGSDSTNSRYQVKLTEPPLPDDAPEEVLLQIGGILQFLDSALRIYAHPHLLELTAGRKRRRFHPVQRSNLVETTQSRCRGVLASRWHDALEQ